MNKLLTIIGLLVILNTISCKNKDQPDDPLEAGWQGKSVCELISEDEKLRILRCTFAPGIGHEKHYHQEHVGYTIAGSRFRIKDENGVREVNVVTGSSFSNKGIKWHEVLNIGDSTAVFLIIEPK